MEVQGLARTALALSTGGSGTYSSLSYTDSAGIGGGVFTFTCNPLCNATPFNVTVFLIVFWVK